MTNRIAVEALERHMREAMRANRLEPRDLDLRRAPASALCAKCSAVVTELAPRMDGATLTYLTKCCGAEVRFVLRAYVTIDVGIDWPKNV